MINGLAFIPADQIPKPDEVNLKTDQVEGALAGHISNCWERNKNAKREVIEQELLNDLRAKRGEYEPKILNEIREQGGSEIYMMLTNAKIRGLKSWIRDIIMPAGDKAWEIEPTPMPDLPGWAEREIANRIQSTLDPQQMDQQQVMERVGKLRDLVLIGLREDAKKRADRMSRKIEDQLVEGGWDEALDQFLDDFSTFSYAIIKGPIKHRRKKIKWQHDEESNVTPIAEDIIQEEVKRISPFDVYPSPQGETPDDGEFIEHIRLSRRELRSFLDVDGYSNKSISDVLEDYGAGGLREWMWLDHERKHLEGKDHWWMSSSEDVIDGVHFWGSVQGKMLLQWDSNLKGIDRYAEYEIDAIKIGRYIIRCKVNKDPLSRRPYQKACFDPVPGSFAGNSLRYLMRDNQSMCNATARAISNNVGMASGPMVEVHSDRLHADEQVEIYPWKVMQTKRGELTGNSPNVHFYQPKLNAHELLRVYEEFERRADDSTGIPRYAMGSDRASGAGRTSSGLAMLMNSASRGVKAAIGQIDLYVTRKIVEKLYFINMLEDKDPSIKGDVNVVARGATALIVKEQAHNDRLEFLQLTNNEMDMQIIGIEGRAKMLREHAKVLDMPNLIPTDDEFKAKMAKDQEKQAEQLQQQQAQDPVLLKLQLDKKKIEVDEASGKEKNKLELDKLHLEKIIEENNNQIEGLINKQKIKSEERMHGSQLAQEKVIQMQLAHIKENDKKTKDSASTDDAYRNREGDIKNILTAIADLKKGQPDKDKPEMQGITYQQPSEIHVHLDSKTGNVTKRIKVDKRDNGGNIESLTSTEESNENE